MRRSHYRQRRRLECRRFGDTLGCTIRNALEIERARLGRGLVERESWCSRGCRGRFGRIILGRSRFRAARLGTERIAGLAPTTTPAATRTTPAPFSTLAHVGALSLAGRTGLDWRRCGFARQRGLGAGTLHPLWLRARRLYACLLRPARLTFGTPLALPPLRRLVRTAAPFLAAFAPLATCLITARLVAALLVAPVRPPFPLFALRPTLVATFIPAFCSLFVASALVAPTAPVIPVA